MQGLMKERKKKNIDLAWLGSDREEVLFLTSFWIQTLGLQSPQQGLLHQQEEKKVFTPTQKEEPGMTKQ